VSIGPLSGQLMAAFRAGLVEERKAAFLGQALQVLVEVYQRAPPAPRAESSARMASLKLRAAEGSLRHLAAWLEAGPTPAELYRAGEVVAAFCQEEASPLGGELRRIADRLGALVAHPGPEPETP